LNDVMSFKVIGIGEVLWDLLPTGPQLGGAPANFACHAQALGANSGIITRVGNDSLGHEIIRRISAIGLPADGVQVDESAPTGMVSVSLSDGIPQYNIHENVAWDRIAASHHALASVRASDAICFGSLAQRSALSRASIQCLVSSATAIAWRVFDINLRQHFYNQEILQSSLELANVLKLNDSELGIIAHTFGVQGNCRRQIESLVSRFGFRVVALTRGASGSILYRDGRWSEHAAVDIEVKDTVGAGDSFTAALCLGLLHGLDLDDINLAANQVAAYVCSCAGATPTLPDALRQRLNPAPAKSDPARTFTAAAEKPWGASEKFTVQGKS
jgi:fructokinase